MRMKKFFVAFLVVLGTAGALYAAPVQWSGNGHFYEVSDDALRWTPAKLSAESRTFDGMNGHLVTITSAAENAFLGSLNLTETYYYTGALQLPGTTDPRANWTWITGEPWVYQNWGWPEPNDAYAAEDNMVLILRSTWGDIDGDAPESYSLIPYIIEYEAAVPEPVSLLIFVPGLVGLVTLRSLRRNS